MANKHLKRDAHRLAGRTNWWWYEEPMGIFVLHEAAPGAPGMAVRPASITIPWSALRAALRRKDKVSDAR